MGGIVSSIFGGGSKKATSQSGNYNNALLTNSLSPALGYLTKAGGGLLDLLGLGGQGARDAAIANFRNTPGYQFQLDEGQNAIGSSSAARGLLNSGSTAKALTRFGQGLADQTYQSHVGNLFNLAGLGNQAASVLSDSGKYNTGTESGSNSSGGLGKAIGFGLSLLGSDRRLKEDIVLVGSHFGMNVYNFRYIGEPTVYKGLMAQEVLEHFPEAVREVDGFLGVDYSMIPNAEDIRYA